MPGRRIVEAAPVRVSGRKRTASARAEGLPTTPKAQRPKLKLRKTKNSKASNQSVLENNVENAIEMAPDNTGVRRSGRQRKPTARALGLDWNDTIADQEQNRREESNFPSSVEVEASHSRPKKINSKVPGHVQHPITLPELSAVDSTTDEPPQNETAESSRRLFPNLVNRRRSVREVEPEPNDESQLPVPTKALFPGLANRTLDTPAQDNNIVSYQGRNPLSRRAAKGKQASKRINNLVQPPIVAPDTARVGASSRTKPSRSIMFPGLTNHRTNDAITDGAPSKAAASSSSNHVREVEFPNLGTRALDRRQSDQPFKPSDSAVIETADSRKNAHHSDLELQPGPSSANSSHQVTAAGHDNEVYIKAEDIDTSFTDILQWPRSDQDYVLMYGRYKGKNISQVEINYARRLLKDETILSQHKNMRAALLWRTGQVDYPKKVEGVQSPPCRCSFHKYPHRYPMNTVTDGVWKVNEMPESVAKRFYHALLDRPFRDCIEEVVERHLVHLERSQRSDARQERKTLKLSKVSHSRLQQKRKTCKCARLSGSLENFIIPFGPYTGVPVARAPLTSVELLYKELESNDHRCSFRYALTQRMEFEYHRAAQANADGAIQLPISPPISQPKYIIKQDKLRDCRCSYMGNPLGYVFPWGKYQGKNITEVPLQYAATYYSCLDSIPHQCGLRRALKYRLSHQLPVRGAPFSVGYGIATMPEFRSPSPTPSLIEDMAGERDTDDDASDIEMDISDDEDSKPDVSLPFPKARRMLRRWGYEVGQGLGLRSTGIADPIELSSQTDKDGLGYSEGFNTGFNEGCFACGRVCHHRSLYQHRFVNGGVYRGIAPPDWVGDEVRFVQRYPESGVALGKRPRLEGDDDEEMPYKRQRSDSGVSGFGV